MSKMYDMIGLINYNLARLHLNLSTVGSQLGLMVISSTTSLLKEKRVEVGVYSSSRLQHLEMVSSSILMSAWFLDSELSTCFEFLQNHEIWCCLNKRRIYRTCIKFRGI